MKTYTPKPEDLSHDWIVVDATDKILGRLATEISRRLRGKHKPEFSNHMDSGDFVVVVNADKIKVTGNKLEQKRYYKHTGHPGGLKSKTLAEMMRIKPENVLMAAVKGMLPKNRLARKQLKKLKIYAGPNHPHEAQQPQTLDI
ncbi:LSU ribosomal protein L13P [Paucidesulfovibrio gracilis DSM 16080]|uniref:Large ribosomal subunit protein uL13 n=1 Tax=Paucidesulfovibrio gracilis DSM 16080 TaxID=1121449 RepID=A0A1T4WYV0_9BACT|nr:50S ribosomal protein L13 [Paucidesulfovibrio gracilis]SKA81771.1 LSU ribosomal protein L13P [Paucidesulfovibrio gracilis DSM 16080]